MDAIGNARAGNAGVAKGGWPDAPEYSRDHRDAQHAPRANRFTDNPRAMVRYLDAAARDGRTTRWEAERIAKFARQARRARWQPTPRQTVWIRMVVLRLARSRNV